MAEPRSRGAGISQQRETESRVGGGGSGLSSRSMGFSVRVYVWSHVWLCSVPILFKSNQLVD